MTRGFSFPVIAKPVRTLAVAIRNPPRTAPLVMPTAGYFLPTAAESTQRTPPKPIVLESFARLGCSPCGNPSATRTECPATPPCFRIVSASTAAGRSRGPALVWRIGDGFCVYRAAGCGHPALYGMLPFITMRAVEDTGPHERVIDGAATGRPQGLPRRISPPCPPIFPLFSPLKTPAAFPVDITGNRCYNMYSLPSIDKDRHGFLGRKCTHTALSPLLIDDTPTT